MLLEPFNPFYGFLVFWDKMSRFWNSTKVPSSQPLLTWVLHFLLFYHWVFQTLQTPHKAYAAMLAHFLLYALKVSPISSQCHSFRIQHIPFSRKHPFNWPFILCSSFSLLSIFDWSISWTWNVVRLHHPLSPL